MNAATWQYSSPLTSSSAEMSVIPVPSRSRTTVGDACVALTSVEHPGRPLCDARAVIDRRVVAWTRLVPSERDGLARLPAAYRLRTEAEKGAAVADAAALPDRYRAEVLHRGRGIASGLVKAALAHAANAGVHTVGLSVWNWRTDAIAVYERLGFAVAPSWEEREGLVCMELGTPIQP